MNGQENAVQGLVERTNACAKQIDSKSDKWVSWLPDIQCKFNHSCCFHKA